MEDPVLQCLRPDLHRSEKKAKVAYSLCLAPYWRLCKSPWLLTAWEFDSFVVDPVSHKRSDKEEERPGLRSHCGQKL